MGGRDLHAGILPRKFLAAEGTEFFLDFWLFFLGFWFIVLMFVFLVI